MTFWSHCFITRSSLFFSFFIRTFPLWTSGQAPWSPRVGAGLVSHWYFNATAGQTLAQSKERIVLVGEKNTNNLFFLCVAQYNLALTCDYFIIPAGGYGGYPPIDPYLDENSEQKYDGFVTRADSWETFDGESWRQLNWNNTFGGRAWMGEFVYLRFLCFRSLDDCDFFFFSSFLPFLRFQASMC